MNKLDKIIEKRSNEILRVRRIKFILDLKIQYGPKFIEGFFTFREK